MAGVWLCLRTDVKAGRPNVGVTLVSDCESVVKGKNEMKDVWARGNRHYGDGYFSSACVGS